MVRNDLAYITDLLHAGVIRGPVLELGAGYGGDTCREAIRGAGLDYYATDMQPGPGVDYVADFEALDRANFDRGFATVLVLNVLEHVFEPIKVTEAALTLLTPGGRLVIVTPTVWPLHHYPIDSQRLLPGWYDRFAERHGVRILREYFRYLPGGSVDEHVDHRGYRYPFIADTTTAVKYAAAVNKIFRTASRGQTVPGHLAIGCVMEKS